MRALRRHHRARVLARRGAIAKAHILIFPEEHRKPIDPRIRHWHFNCNCFEHPAERGAERRRAERDWRSREGVT